MEHLTCCSMPVHMTSENQSAFKKVMGSIADETGLASAAQGSWQTWTRMALAWSN